MEIEATLLEEIGADFTTEHLGIDVGGQFGLEDFEGGPVIQIIRLKGGPGDDPDEKPMRSFSGD